MGRQLFPAPTVSGTIKSIQHISKTVGVTSTNTQNQSITSVGSTSNAYLIENGNCGGMFGANANDQLTFSFGRSSKCNVQLTSDTNVAFQMNDLDASVRYGSHSAVSNVSVVEVS
tara:strand:- start:1953 stop:2297 length:345 start_codon:yes stop_codon:yes gene_type:complete